MQIDLNKYTEFVEAITSETSNSPMALSGRINTLSADFNVALAITAAMGMSGEAGEFSEIVN